MSFKTVYQESESLDVINKSKFIGYCKPVTTVEEAQAFIEQIRKKHWDASHNVPVYVLGEKMHVQKASDDGEPSGTAGVPILNILKNENITNLVIVITRYFGGIKLGTGGLVRAYSQSAKSALEAAKVIEMQPYHLLHVSMNYTLHGKFQNHLMQHPEYFIEDTVYTDDVMTSVYIHENDLDAFKKEVINMTHDQCKIETVKEEMLKISNNQWIKEAL